MMTCDAHARSVRNGLPLMTALLCVLMLTISCTSTQRSNQVSLSQLREGFANPPKEAKVRTWWHWLDGNVTREGITADLEAMHRVGIQEATLFNGGMGFPQGPVEYMSPEWLDLLQHAASEAKRLGMELSFHNGPGWSSSGGPWVKPEDAMQTVTYSERRIEGGRTMSVVLEKPQSRHEFYQDIAVLAFPTPQSEQRINGLEEKTLSNNHFKSHLMPETRDVDERAIVKREDIVNLSDRMLPGGTLTWEVPEGNWTILRIGFTPTGMTNHPALAGGNGLECDKMSRKALDAFWQGGIQPIIDKLGSLVGTALTGSLIDSYEVGCGNWTPGFEQEFAARRHYDLTTYLPALAGYYVDGGNVAERFLWDLRLTVGELMAENYYEYFGELCHKHGMRFLTEPYEGPFNAMEVGAPADVPMSEFWVGSNMFGSVANLAASIAHQNGNQVVGAESFTAAGGESRHRNYPGMLKAQGDLNWTNGVNRFILHTNAHQPWEVGPGFSLGQYGTNFNRHNTWWEQGRAWMDYCARSQYLLQQGQGVQDVLVFIGESSPNMGTDQPEIRQLGLDYDQISASDVRKLTVQDGLLRTAVGRIYRLMTLPAEEQPTLSLLQQLKSLTDAGALIIGKRPEGSPSLDGYPQSDVEYQTLVNELWGKDNNGKIRDIGVEDAMKETGLLPDFSGGYGDQRLCFLHRSTSEAEVYFVSNQQKDYRTELCRFRVEGLVPELWNAQTGSMENVPVWRSSDGITEIPLSFKPEEAYFIVFRQPAEGDVQYTAASQTLKGPAPELLPDLEIVHADYGQFLPFGLMDVTDKVSGQVRDGHLSIDATNDFAGGDPCFGIVKSMRVKYIVGDQQHTITVSEKQHLELPQQGEEGELAILTAFYGKVPTLFDNVRAPEAVDVTNLLKQKIAAGQFIIPAGEIKAPLPGQVEGLEAPKLHLIYKVGETWHDQFFTEGMTINLAQHKPEPSLVIEDGKPVWYTPEAGELRLTKADGTTAQAQIDAVPDVLPLGGTWTVDFKQKWGPQWQRKFPELMSFSDVDDDDNVKYFSGTAIYTGTFALPKNYCREDIRLMLDLGQVFVMAEVFVNGDSLGILWNEPYETDITKVAREGENQIELRATNQWVNRLIGDEQLPADFKAEGEHYTEWPDWMQKPEAGRPSGRTTFVAHKHWQASDQLLPAGLVGPVVIRPYVRAAVE